jgi:hypothetical protein
MAAISACVGPPSLAISMKSYSHPPGLTIAITCPGESPMLIQWWETFGGSVTTVPGPPSTTSSPQKNRNDR